LDSQLRKIAFAIKNSTTIILPQWFAVLQELDFSKQMMPRDVKTRWNSTFDMLDFAVEHITAIDTITGDRDMKLRQYELSEEDWDIARQLRDVLKVHGYFFVTFCAPNRLIRSSKTRHYFFHEVHPTSRALYLPWITLMRTLPPLQLNMITPLQSRLPSQSRKKLSTGITIKLIIQKFSGLLWVYDSCCLSFLHIF
jgi:hypothetical protein